jgi:dUTP pyrophosphatase
MALFKTSNIPKDYEYVLCFKTDNKYLKSLYNTKSEYLYSNKHKGNTHKDSGFDLYIPEIETIPAGEIKILDLDVKCAAYETGYRLTPSPYYLYPRSSISKRGLMLTNSVGIIDCGYRGNLMIALYNTTKEDVVVNKGDRLVQICLPKLCNNFTAEVVENLTKTERGGGGIGSTGK